MKKLLKIVTALATVVLAGCGGGGDDVPTGPAYRLTGAQAQAGGPPRPWLLFYMDAAEPTDYEEAVEGYRHAYVAEPIGALLATDEPSASTARLILIDALGTDAVGAVRVLR